MSMRLNWAERLVVVAILAILLTLLMPSIQQGIEMRRRARWAADAQMQRQHIQHVPATPRVTSPEVQEEPHRVFVLFVQGENGELGIFVLAFAVERRPNEDALVSTPHLGGVL